MYGMTTAYNGSPLSSMEGLTVRALIFASTSPPRLKKSLVVFYRLPQSLDNPISDLTDLS